MADIANPTRVDKPWGYELHWAKTDRYVGKLIHVNKGHALSLQYHVRKDETIYLHAGLLPAGHVRGRSSLPLPVQAAVVEERRMRLRGLAT